MLGDNSTRERVCVRVRERERERECLREEGRLRVPEPTLLVEPD